MKINLHCHSNYSDGDDIFEMAEEHKKQGFSAFVVTDHVYPLMMAQDKANHYSMCINSYGKFQRQTTHLAKVSKQLDFPCLQGIELALYQEEVLVFGQKAIRDIFDYLEGLDLEEQKKYGKRTQYKKKVINHLFSILKKNKEDSAVIFCHPHIIETPDWVLKPLYEIVDGYEFQNGRTYYFSDETIKGKKHWEREVPPELKAKKKFYNSDAHSISAINRSEGNFHSEKITTMEELIKFIKTPQNSNQLALSRKNSRSE